MKQYSLLGLICQIYGFGKRTVKKHMEMQVSHVKSNPSHWRSQCEATFYRIMLYHFTARYARGCDLSLTLEYGHKFSITLQMKVVKITKKKINRNVLWLLPILAEEKSTAAKLLKNVRWMKIEKIDCCGVANTTNVKHNSKCLWFWAENVISDGFVPISVKKKNYAFSDTWQHFAVPSMDRVAKMKPNSTEDLNSSYNCMLT